MHGHSTGLLRQQPCPQGCTDTVSVPQGDNCSVGVGHIVNTFPAEWQIVNKQSQTHHVFQGTQDAIRVEKGHTIKWVVRGGFLEEVTFKLMSKG